MLRIISAAGAATLVLLAGSSATAGKIAWPDPSISIPDEVRAYVLAECEAFRGWGEETFDECVSGELYGYRAVVTILMDEKLGEAAARRYRGCAVGLGDLGGRFHRRKAECVSTAFNITWRFEFSEKAGLGEVLTAETATPRSEGERRAALAFAMSVID